MGLRPAARSGFGTSSRPPPPPAQTESMIPKSGNRFSGKDHAPASDLAAVIGPVQQRLALARTAEHVARLAILLDLPHVAADRLPAPDLRRILRRHAAAHVVAAVPLKPAARIVLVDPSLAPPFGQRLA